MNKREEIGHKPFTVICLQKVQIGVPFVSNDLNRRKGTRLRVRKQNPKP